MLILTGFFQGCKCKDCHIVPPQRIEACINSPGSVRLVPHCIISSTTNAGTLDVIYTGQTTAFVGFNSIGTTGIVDSRIYTTGNTRLFVGFGETLVKNGKVYALLPTSQYPLVPGTTTLNLNCFAPAGECPLTTYSQFPDDPNDSMIAFESCHSGLRSIPIDASALLSFTCTAE